MPTKREMGYRIFRASGSAASSGASKVGGTTDTSSTVRYGTAVADSSGGRVQVKLDNSDSVVNCTCDTLIYKDDRVTVIVTSTGLMKAIPIGQNLVDYTDKKSDDLAQDIINQGNQIREDVADDIAEIDAKVDAAQAAADAAQGRADEVGEQANQIQSDLTEKADELAGQIQVVDTEIDGLNSTITGVAFDATSALTQVAQVKSDVNGLEVTVAQQVETLDGTISRVSKTETDISGLNSTVSSVSKTLDGTVESVSTLKNTVNGLSQTVTQTTKTANDALSKTSTLENTVDGMQSTVSQAYSNSQEALTQTSSLSNTVKGLSSNVTTAYENAQEALTQSSEAKQTANTVQTTLSTNYYTKGQTDQTFASQTQLTQTQNSILSQVSNKYQVKGDYPTTKDMNTAIEQSASQIQSTVEENVMNEVGETYATKTQLTQTSSDLKATFTAGLNTKGKLYVDRPNPPYYVGDVYIDTETGDTYVCTVTRESGSYVSSDWSSRDPIVSGYVRQSVGGVEVGLSGSSYTANIANSGFSIERNGVVFTSLYDGYAQLGNVLIIDSGSSCNIGPVSRIGTNSPEGTGFTQNSFSVSDAVDFFNGSGGYVEVAGTSGSTRYWRWNNDRKEASGMVNISFPYGEKYTTVSLPFYYSTDSSYRIFLQIMSNPVGGASMKNFTKLHVAPVNVERNSFQIYGWNDYSGNLNFNVGWYTIGV